MQTPHSRIGTIFSSTRLFGGTSVAALEHGRTGCAQSRTWRSGWQTGKLRKGSPIRKLGALSEQPASRRAALSRSDFVQETFRQIVEWRRRLPRFGNAPFDRTHEPPRDDRPPVRPEPHTILGASANAGPEPGSRYARVGCPPVRPSPCLVPRPGLDCFAHAGRPSFARARALAPSAPAAVPPLRRRSGRLKERAGAPRRYRSSGRRPVCLAMRASILGPISSRS